MHALYAVCGYVCVKELDRRLQHIVHQPTKFQSQKFVQIISFLASLLAYKQLVSFELISMTCVNQIG